MGESDRGLLLLTALGIAGVSEADVTIAVLGESAPLLANSLQNGQVSGVVGAISDFVAIRSQDVQIKNLLPPEMGDQPANNYAIRADAIGGENEEVLQGLPARLGEGVLRGSCGSGRHTHDGHGGRSRELDQRRTWHHLPAGGPRVCTAQTEQVFGDVRHEMSGTLCSRTWWPLTCLMRLFPTEEILNDHYLAGANDFDRAEVGAEVAAWKDRQVNAKDLAPILWGPDPICQRKTEFNDMQADETPERPARGLGRGALVAPVCHEWRAAWRTFRM